MPEPHSNQLNPNLSMISDIHVCGEEMSFHYSAHNQKFQKTSPRYTETLSIPLVFQSIKQILVINRIPVFLALTIPSVPANADCESGWYFTKKHCNNFRKEISRPRTGSTNTVSQSFKQRLNS